MKNISFKSVFFVLFLIILSQCIVFLWALSKRDGLYVDELWTFNLADSYFFPLLGEANDYFGVWLSSDFFQKVLTVDPAHRFAYF